MQRKVAMHEINVTVVSAEEAADGTAEFWSGGRMNGFTQLASASHDVRAQER